MRWIVLALLLTVTSINYLYRLLLSVLSPILRDHFHFSESLYGNINAAFQICYAFGFLASGWLLDKYGVKYNDDKRNGRIGTKKKVEAPAPVAAVTEEEVPAPSVVDLDAN